jgi:hypothetical protein
MAMAMEMACRCGKDNGRRNPVGIAGCPFQGLYAAHAPAKHGQQFVFAQVVQQQGLCPNHILTVITEMTGYSVFPSSG